MKHVLASLGVSLTILILAACSPSSVRSYPPAGAPTENGAARIPFVPTPAASPFLVPGVPHPLPPLEFIKMMDAKTGWAVTAETERLLRTADGGMTWQDVTPNLEAIITPSAFFLDGLHVWALTFDEERASAAGSNSLLYRSADGGRSWETFSMPFRGGLLEFRDSWEGWAFVVPEGSYTTSAAALVYHTLDGGRTWSRLALKDPAAAPGSTAPPGGITVQAGDDLEFQAGSTLWLRGRAPAGSPDALLWVSWDGGQTWQPERVPLPQPEPASGADLISSLPVFPTPLDGFFTAAYTLPAGASPAKQMAFFVTHDGGKSWSASPAVLPGAGVSDPLDFVDAQDGFIACGQGLCATHDGAQSWQGAAAGLDISPDKDRPLIGYSFGDAQTGFAIVADSLYHTTDGGVSWQAAQPTFELRP
jgi:photosystem II stability/assembly factor-like uncharacterized protein